MYLRVKKKKIMIKELFGFWNRFKGLKFVLDPIDYVIKFSHKKFVTTNFLCQKVDIILTNKEDKILYIYENFKSEQYILPKRKVYNVYFLPLHTAKHFKIGEKLTITEK